MTKPLNITQKLIKSHLISGKMEPGSEIALKIDQVLQQDATGTLVMLELESIGLDDIKAELGVQYVDHNILQTDFRNADDHKFLQSSSKKFGYHYSRAGNGISHVVHMEQFGIPGKTLLGSDSHTCAGGGLGMLAIGTGGLDIAFAVAGEPYFVEMPKILGVELSGQLPDWVSAKDVVLEMLRRYDVKGAKNYIVEYYGEGVNHLSTWDRHVIANMGTEMGATTSVFPSDEVTREFLKQQKREEDWMELKADDGADYDKREKINLSELEPLIACPSSPGNVVPVSEVAGKEISQVVVGSSANPGYRDFWIVAETLKNYTVDDHVSLDINPSSRQKIYNLTKYGQIENFMASGARFHQTGCLGCIGMGQSPAKGQISLRTMPRNFPGRSGTADDQVYLCSPETAVASAVRGKITDPRDLAIDYPSFQEPEPAPGNLLIQPPRSGFEGEIEKGPNIQSIPDLEPLPDQLTIPVLLKMKDNISTDEILKAGTEVLPLRSNIPEISKYAYIDIDDKFYEKAKGSKSGHLVIAGENYAQGSSREHAALAPRFLGQKIVIAKSYARIGWQNLINYGILPLEFQSKTDYDKINEGDVLTFQNLRDSIKKNGKVIATNKMGEELKFAAPLTDRQKQIILAGGAINTIKQA